MVINEDSELDESNASDIEYNNDEYGQILFLKKQRSKSIMNGHSEIDKRLMHLLGPD